MKSGNSEQYSDSIYNNGNIENRHNASKTQTRHVDQAQIANLEEDNYKHET